MKLLQKESDSGKSVPILLLLAAGIIEFLFITLESRFSGIGYYLAETYLIVPSLLFLGYVLREKQTRFARQRLLLAVTAISWFVIVQSIHKLSGTETHPIATVFFVYLMAFPFAALADDRENAGILWIGRLFVAANLVLVGYTVILVLGPVPAGLQEVLFWDGARLHALWHPNVAACYLMIGIGFSAAFLVRTKKIWGKVLLLAAMVLQFLAMALTNCRTVLLMTGALLGGVAFFRIFRGNWKQFLLGLLAAAVLLVGSFKLSGMIFLRNNDRLVAAMQASNEETNTSETMLPAQVSNTETVQTETVNTEAVQTEVSHTEPAQAETEPTEETIPEKPYVMEDTGVINWGNPQGTLSGDMRTLNGRTQIWEAALSAVRDNRALALWGTEYAGTVISAYHTWEAVHAHNSWIETLLRMGLPGLLLSLVFTGLSIWSAVRLVLGKETELWKRILAMTTMCVLVSGFLEPYLFITNVYYHTIDFTFFFCTGYLDYWCRSKKTN